MAVSYTVVNNATTLKSGRRFVPNVPSGMDTYTFTRAYLKFDLSALGLTVDQIESVVFRIYNTQVYGSPSSHRLRTGSPSDNWGDVLQANEADFFSTQSNIEDVKLIDGGGWFEFAVNKTHLKLDGVTYFRISDINEGDAQYAYVLFASQTANPGYRPVLRITLAIPTGPTKKITGRSPISMIKGASAIVDIEGSGAITSIRGSSRIEAKISGRSPIKKAD